MGQPVVHFEVIGKDGNKLRSFYSEVFGWDFQVMGGPMDYGVIGREGNTDETGAGIGGGVGGLAVEEGHVTFYVQVPDIKAALGKIEGVGGKRVNEPDEVPGQGILVCHFTDPEGHVIGLVQPTS